MVISLESSNHDSDNSFQTSINQNEDPLILVDTDKNQSPVAVKCGLSIDVCIFQCVQSNGLCSVFNVGLDVQLSQTIS